MQAIAKMLVVVILLATNMSVTLASPLPGPGYAVRRVNANSTMIFNDTFRGGERAVVSIVGDGTTDLDLYIYDNNGRLVARAIGLTDRETITFFPSFTSNYRIEVRNLGNVWNEFVIVTR
jgi:hypothetical protein